MRRELIGGLLLLATVSACAAPSAGGSGYELTEYSVSGPTTLPSGIEDLTVTNAGDFPHTLIVTDEAGVALATTSLVQPGETVTLDIALDPGSYQFSCRIVVETGDGRLVDHYEAGMTRTVGITG